MLAIHVVRQVNKEDTSSRRLLRLFKLFKKCLIEQLEFEGFNNEDATYAADQVGFEIDRYVTRLIILTIKCMT